MITPAPDDKRFKNEVSVEKPLFDFMKQCYLLLSQHVQSAVRSVEGIDPHTSRKAQFYTRQLVNALSPTNFAATNPDVLKATVDRAARISSGPRSFDRRPWARATGKSDISG